MLNNEVLIDLEDENNENNEDNNEHTDFWISMNLEDNNEENDDDKNNEEEIEKNKNNEEQGEENNEEFWVSTSLEDENMGFIKQMAENGINDNIDNEIYDEILNKTKKKNKFINISLAFFALSIIWTSLTYVYQNNSEQLTSILWNIKNEVIKSNINEKEENNSNINEEIDTWENASQQNIDSQDDIRKQIEKELNENNVGSIKENKWEEKKELENLKQDITSYYKEQIEKKVKGLKKTTKDKMIFKYNILKYEFNNNTIDFKTFNKQTKNIINNIK